MALMLAPGLPAAATLAREGLAVLPISATARGRPPSESQNPLRLGILNLMPTKEATELQLLRLIGGTQVDARVGLIRMGSHESRNVSREHVDSFYVTAERAMRETWDGMIITGAPVETLDFDQVDYWPELASFIDWCGASVGSVMHICWGAQAGLWRRHRLPKHPLAAKTFGVFEHRLVAPGSPIARGFDELFQAPHSRHTEVRAEEAASIPDLEVVAVSPEAGLHIALSRDERMVYVMGHPEYDRLTLKAEYDRDRGRGMDIAVPAHYFPGDDPAGEPSVTWRAHGRLLYENWLRACLSFRS